MSLSRHSITGCTPSQVDRSSRRWLTRCKTGLLLLKVRYRRTTLTQLRYIRIHTHTLAHSLTHSLACTHIHTFNYQGDPPYDPKKVLKNLVDHDGLYNILGNTIIAFMSMKPQPYLKHALASKQNFWHVPTYKRAVTFVFLVRYVLGFKSQNQWKKFTSADYKLNTRCFKRFCTLEHKVFEKSDTYHELPDARESDDGEPLKRKSSSSFSESSPVKRRFVINDDSTDED